MIIMTKKPFFIFNLGYAVLFCTLLASCGNVRNTLGLNKDAPDEFAVVTRAPLEMPPTMALPTPRPGMPRPQEQAPSESARTTLTGYKGPSQSETITEGENFILKKMAAEKTDPSIRMTIDRETAELAEKNMPVVQKITGLGGKQSEPPASIVDAKAELERLKKNAKEGKSVTEGETPSIEE